MSFEEFLPKDRRKPVGVSRAGRELHEPRIGFE